MRALSHLGARRYLRVNGALIMSRGASVVPTDELEGWMDADAHVALVRAAADAHFNTLRIWGGVRSLPFAAVDTLTLLRRLSDTAGIVESV